MNRIREIIISIDLENSDYLFIVFGVVGNWQIKLFLDYNKFNKSYK